MLMTLKPLHWHKTKLFGGEVHRVDTEVGLFTILARKSGSVLRFRSADLNEFTNADDAKRFAFEHYEKIIKSLFM